MIAVSPISAYLISGYGWQKSYFLLSLVAFLTMMPAALLLKKPPTSTETVPTERARERKNAEIHDFSLSQAIRIRSFWFMIFILFLLSICSYAVLTHVVPHAIDLGVLEEAGYVKIT